jgi:hypothetical protein
MNAVFCKILILWTILFSCAINAQRKKGEYINACLGFGLSAPYDDSGLSGSGFYAQGEYVIAMSKWFSFKPYAGIILTSENQNDNQQSQILYKVTSKAFLLGAKARFSAPIPYVAPYFETGLGISVGSFETYTPDTNISKNGPLMHIPFAIGLAVGKKHNIDIGFTYYYHQSAKQFAGATAFGLSFPINN